MKKDHILSMFDRIDNFKNLSPNVPEAKVRQYLSELEEFLINDPYRSTLSKIKPQITDVYDILMSQSEDLEYLEKLNERMIMYLKQLHTLIQYNNQGKLEQEREEDADGRELEAVRYLIV